MMISDPPLLFDVSQIGQKVSFNQHKQDSMDGFIKVGEECLAILPSVYKLTPGNQGDTKAQNVHQNGVKNPIAFKF